MAVKLFEHQEKALSQLKVGSILRGGTGSGKSLTAVAYYYINICGGSIENGYILPMKEPRDLYIITTAKKRDQLEWEKELAYFLLGDDNVNGVNITIDSWNNIEKYVNAVGAFFIFDEQRVVGKGSWVKKFLRITKANKWILLSATPGDKWEDYIPVFVANGFYKNRTEFIRRHVVYKRFAKFPQVERYLEVDRLEKMRDYILVDMDFVNDVKINNINIFCDFPKDMLKYVGRERYNIFSDKPIKQVAEYYSVVRRIVNSDISRAEAVKKILKDHPRVIIFYNFNYELDILKNLCEDCGVACAEWNGHKHQDIPRFEPSWIYLVQYSAGSEGWNCIETNTIIFYSQNYSYRAMVQAAGRINRLDTPFRDLYYYRLRSYSWIDLAIAKSLDGKKNFNEDKNVLDRPSAKTTTL